MVAIAFLVACFFWRINFSLYLPLSLSLSLSCYYIFRYALGALHTSERATLDNTLPFFEVRLSTLP